MSDYPCQHCWVEGRGPSGHKADCPYNDFTKQDPKTGKYYVDVCKKCGCYLYKWEKDTCLSCRTKGKSKKKKRPRSSTRIEQVPPKNKAGGSNPSGATMTDKLEKLEAAAKQDMPVRNDGACIQDLAIKDVMGLGAAAPLESCGRYLTLAADLKARKEAGIKKYGTVLQAFNGRDAVLDLYQEYLDAIVYFKQVIVEAEMRLDLDRRIVENHKKLYLILIDNATLISYNHHNGIYPPNS